jgi:hypothetical protein
MPRVPPFAALVSEQINRAETRRAQHLRLLRCVRDIHGRLGTACAGLAGLVPTHAREEKESGDDTGHNPRTH